MARSVVWSEPAWDDLEEIADHIADDNPRAAIELAGKARDAARSLAELSHRGRPIHELADLEMEMREIFVGRYRLIYQVEADQVVVHGLIHTARDLFALWEREGRGARP